MEKPISNKQLKALYRKYLRQVTKLTEEEIQTMLLPLDQPLCKRFKTKIPTKH